MNDTKRNDNNGVEAIEVNIPLTSNENEESDNQGMTDKQGLTDKQEIMTNKAKTHYDDIRKELKLCQSIAETEIRKDPASWLKKFFKKMEPKTEENYIYKSEELENYIANIEGFEKDENYIAYIQGFLELVIDNPLADSKDVKSIDICTPFFILKTILITEDQLRKRQDPMRTALQLQHRLRRSAKKERDSNTIYHKDLFNMQRIPEDFAFRLLDECISPFEVKKLLCLDNDEIHMFQDVLKSKNKNILSSQIFRNIVLQQSYGKNTSEAITWTYVCRRLACFIGFNLFSPIFFFNKWCKNRKIDRFADQFFSPICSYIADLFNYLIMFVLLLYVTLATVPDPAEISAIALKIAQSIDNTTANNTTASDVTERNVICSDSGDVMVGNGTVLVCLPIPEVFFSEWTLWLCMMSRILTEVYQGLWSKKKGFWSKLKKYTKGHINKVDIVMVLFILAGMLCKLHLYISSQVSGFYKTYYDLAEGQHELVSRRLIYTIHFYSMAAIFALVNLFYSCFIFAPGIGPLLRSIQKMFVDLGTVLIMLIFFSGGFLMPLYSMVRCYRAVYAIEATKNRTDFDTMKSISESAMTLAWNIFGSQEYTGALYESQDRFTTFFMTVSLFAYTVVLSIMCLNLLLAMVCNRYQRDIDNKYVDWHFSQFSLLMYYNAGCDTEHGMPLIFPFCIPYTLYCMMKIGTRDQKDQEKETAINDFAKLLCEHRVKRVDKKEEGWNDRNCRKCSRRCSTIRE